ncbi:unnamed protein product [Rhizophagus irregularis]|nr:unnamed protein product [Rhizophagus irregularis]CAB4396714.1 unnamed protein product [Rhizophagus irregularis]CAB5367484.1 unnamed protein product [Rhizophagus irregularis]
MPRQYYVQPSWTRISAWTSPGHGFWLEIGTAFLDMNFGFDFSWTWILAWNRYSFLGHEFQRTSPGHGFRLGIGTAFLDVNFGLNFSWT